MIHSYSRRQHLPRTVAWLVVGLGLAYPCQPPQPALAQGAKLVVHFSPARCQVEGRRGDAGSKELLCGPGGLPAVAVLNPAVRDLVVRSLKSFDSPTKRLLGVDSWSVK
jgi:hypothetical protein